MPQKRNPDIITDARQSASDVAASLQFVLLRIHNVTPGMTEYKSTFEMSGIMEKTLDMLELRERHAGASNKLRPLFRRT